jgi:hypothetical protein
MKKLLFMMLLAVALLAACGDDTASNDGNEPNNEATNPEETVKPDEEETVNNDNDADEANANEDEGTEEDDATAGNNSGFADDQQLTLGEAGVFDSTIGTVEITVNSVRAVDEIDGQDPLSDLFIIAEITVENVGDETQEAEDFKTAAMMNDEETHVSSVVSFSNLEGDIEPGESVDGELVFDIKESNYN